VLVFGPRTSRLDKWRGQGGVGLKAQALKKKKRKCKFAPIEKRTSRGGAQIENRSQLR